MGPPYSFTWAWHFILFEIFSEKVIILKRLDKQKQRNMDKTKTIQRIHRNTTKTKKYGQDKEIRPRQRNTAKMIFKGGPYVFPDKVLYVPTVGP